MTRAFALLRSAVVAPLFVSLWTWFVPRWIAMSKRVALEPQLAVVSMILMILGGAIMLRCVFDFAWTGRGTPAPWDPPRRLVIRGLYRWVRNPMYVGMGLFLIGEALMLTGIQREMFILIASLFAVVTAFVMLYEEPTLRATFGDDYEEYCREVRRWIPRLTPFDKSSERAVPSPHLD
ncbi:MAG TPA: isoprenylcysteine carboxylmethyltransferase family protein [Thermoanaerobaculia bacterium]|nr:isoprenylcysteine carboxylmethyltransferase family protein [Thermoanaerobaculia bacterium]